MNQADLIKAGERLFEQKPIFVRGVVDEVQLPTSYLPEIAFAGRSNVGKSSLINAITGVPKLARTSNTPGRTQELNFFEQKERVTKLTLSKTRVLRIGELWSNCNNKFRFWKHK